jgi:cytosine deaminase
MLDLLLRGARVPEGDGLVDIAIAGDRIAEVAATGPVPRPAARVVDLAGRVVTPGLVEAHMHLDKAFLTDRVSASAGTVEEAIRLTGEAKRRFTVDDVRGRARRVLDLAIAAGTTAMRSHVEVDPIVGLMGLEALLPLKEEYAPAIDLQLCAFAQEGILKSPGTEALLRRALQLGADLVGGCPYNDTDARKHIEIVFRLAESFGVDADFHVDFADEPEHLHVKDVVAETVRAGWQGRVAVGHLTELAALPGYEQDDVVAAIAEAGVAVISLPITDLYLMGRRDESNVRRGLTPIRKLLAAGVPVALASNNVCNPFTPIGTADLTHVGFVAAAAAHLGTPGDLRAILRMLTTDAARVIGLTNYGLAPGHRADLVGWECTRVEEIVATLPDRAFVCKAGRITIEHTHTVRQPWRQAPATVAGSGTTR